ncbi:hypothetical protein Tco_0788410 [Tanacetum coccineum]
MGDSISSKVSLEVRSILEATVIVDDHAEGEKSKEGQMDENANPATTQGEHSNVEKNVAIPDASQGEHKSDNAMVIRQTTNLKKLMMKQTMASLTRSLCPKKFTDKLFQTTSSSFSPTPLKEPSPPRDPAKGKGVDMEEPVNILVPFMDERGSNPKMPRRRVREGIEEVAQPSNRQSSDVKMERA